MAVNRVAGDWQSEILANRKLNSVKEISSRFKGTSTVETVDANLRRVRNYRNIPSLSTLGPDASVSHFTTPRKRKLMAEWVFSVRAEKNGVLTTEAAKDFLAHYGVTSDKVDHESWMDWLDAIELAVNHPADQTTDPFAPHGPLKEGLWEEEHGEEAEGKEERGGEDAFASEPPGHLLDHEVSDGDQDQADGFSSVDLKPLRLSQKLPPLDSQTKSAPFWDSEPSSASPTTVPPEAVEAGADANASQAPPAEIDGDAAASPPSSAEDLPHSLSTDPNMPSATFGPASTQGTDYRRDEDDDEDEETTATVSIENYPRFVSPTPARPPSPRIPAEPVNVSPPPPPPPQPSPAVLASRPSDTTPETSSPAPSESTTVAPVTTPPPPEPRTESSPTTQNPLHVNTTPLVTTSQPGPQSSPSSPPASPSPSSPSPSSSSGWCC